MQSPLFYKIQVNMEYAEVKKSTSSVEFIVAYYSKFINIL